MKKKAVVLGLVGAMALGTCTVSAANGTRNISATFRNIKIVVDGKQVSTSAEPFIYNGTTYLPIRAVGEAVGKEVTWDAGTNTVYLGEVPTSAQQAQASAQQQAPAPEAPAAAVSSDLPILAEYEGATTEEVHLFLTAMRSQEVSVWEFYYIYTDIIDDAMNAGNTQLAWSAYNEALAAFDFVAGAPDCAEVKALFISEQTRQ